MPPLTTNQRRALIVAIVLVFLYGLTITWPRNEDGTALLPAPSRSHAPASKALSRAAPAPAPTAQSSAAAQRAPEARSAESSDRLTISPNEQRSPRSTFGPESSSRKDRPRGSRGDPQIKQSALPGNVSEVSSRAKDPVYRVSVEPGLSKSGEKLPLVRAGQSTTLRIDIGSREASAAFAGKVNRSILDSKEDVYLRAMIACSFCEELAPLTATLHFDAQRKVSNVIEFQFVPASGIKRGVATYEGLITVSLVSSMTAQEVDRIALPFGIVSESDARVRSGAPIAVSKQIINRETTKEALVDLRIDIASAGDDATIQIEPHSPEMVDAIGKFVYTEPDRTLKKFAISSSKVRALLSDAREVSAKLAYQIHPDAQDDAKTRPVGMPEPLSIAANGERLAVPDMKLSTLDRERLLDVMITIGSDLYEALFQGRLNTDLSKAIARVEELGNAKRDRPIRILVYTNGLTFPWQLLVPHSPAIDPLQIWGFKYSLSTIRTDPNSFNQIDRGSAPKLIGFASYSVRKPPSLVEMAEIQLGSLKKAVTPMEVRPFTSGPKFSTSLIQERARYAGVFFFLHASSGRQVRLNDDVSITDQDDAGPRVMFSPKDQLLARDLRRLPRAKGMPTLPTGSFFLSSAPLVVLNACETGPSLTINDRIAFEDALYELGARGMVLTEVVVFIPFAHLVNMQLIEHLAKGELAADALTAVRLQLLKEYNNPMGLIYSYHGDPAATLFRQ